MNYFAGQAEILRSSQKDEFYTSRLISNILNLLQSNFGIKFSLKFKSEIENFTKFLYDVLTTGLGNQTLGEEYVNIIQTNGTHLAIPSFFQRALFIILKNLNLIFLKKLIIKLNNYFKNKNFFDISQCNVEKIISIFQVFSSIHLILFYLSGKYLHFSKRISGIRYVSIRPWLLKNQSYSYKLLGLLTILKYLLKLFGKKSDASNSYLSQSSDRILNNLQRVKCSLCLEIATDLSSTECGHLFCWNCIIEWTTRKSYCPLCKADVNPSKIVFLQNY